MIPKISVVLPVFNGAADLPRTIESILGQTESDFELIAIDDGSTDETGALLAEYASRDTRIRVLTQPNAGLTRALIHGCDAARASLIARHDCGDVSHPDRLRRVSESLGAGRECVVACCEVAYTGPNGEALYTTAHAKRDLRGGLLRAGIGDIVSLPAGAAALMWADAYRKAGGYRAQFYFAQDVDLWIRLAALGELCIVPEALYEARINVRAISSIHRAEQFACAKIAVAVRDAPTESERAELLKQAATIRPKRRSFTRRVEAQALYFVATCLRKQNDPRWRAYASRALRCNALHLRSWLLLLRG